jgi:putative peptidoglycan lipid II flippase
MSLVKKFATVGGSTLISRMFGFGREMLMATALGTGPMADAFYAAFVFPNLFRRLFAEGAFNAAFVPLFAREIETGGNDAAKRFSEEVFGVLFTVLLLLTIAMELAMPLIVRTIIAPGFDSQSEKYAATYQMALIMFPYLMCMSLTAMLSGMLNSLQHFFAAAIAPVFLNLMMIAALAYSIWFGTEAKTTALYLSYAVLIAGILQMAVLYFGVRHAGMSLSFKRPRMTENVRRLLWLAFPAAVTGGITQINQLVGQMIASGKNGAISALQFADRLYQLPLGVVGIAVGIVLLPELSRALRAGREAEANNIQNRSMEFVLLLTLPAAGAIWVLSDELIRVVFEHGAFTAAMTSNVASTLAIYGLGLPGFVMIKALTPGFFAREDTKTPMRFTMASVAVNCALAISLFPFFSERGIATAATVSGWLTVALLFATLLRRGHWVWEPAFGWRIVRLVMSAIIMAIAMHFAAISLSQWFQPQTSIFHQVAALFALIALAMIVYFTTAFASGGADFGLLRRSLKRRKQTPAEPENGNESGLD